MELEGDSRWTVTVARRTARTDIGGGLDAGRRAEVGSWAGPELLRAVGGARGAGGLVVAPQGPWRREGRGVAGWALLVAGGAAGRWLRRDGVRSGRINAWLRGCVLLLNRDVRTRLMRLQPRLARPASMIGGERVGTLDRQTNSSHTAGERVGGVVRGGACRPRTCVIRVILKCEEPRLARAASRFACCEAGNPLDQRTNIRHSYR